MNTTDYMTIPAWILVSDRLPPDRERVLIYDSLNGVCEAEYHHKNRWYAYEQWGIAPTHWMPMIQPPTSKETP